jgi:O-antigen ligase/tetratricopeptide (TPR) repeat protein
MISKSAGFTRLLRDTSVILIIAYVLLLGGGFGALVGFRVQALSTVIAILVIGGWLAARIIRRERIDRSGIELAILLFLGSQLIAVIFSDDPRRSIPHTILWIVYFLIFYLVLDLFRRGWSQEILFRSLLLVGTLLMAFSLLDLAQLFMQYRELTAGLGLVPRFQQRLSTIVGDPNLLAAVLNLLVPVALATLFLAKRKLVQGLLAAYVVFSVVVLYFTDSRGGLLGFATAVGVLGLLWVFIVSEPIKKKAKYWANWIWQRKVVLVAGVVLLALVVGFVAWRFLSFQGSTTHAPAHSARDIYWQAATNAVTADPLTGAGPGMYPIYLMKIWSMPPARPYLHAHGFPFQVAAESGLLGLTAVLILVIAIVRKAWTAWRSLDVQARGRWAAAVAGVLGLSVHILVDDFFPFPAVGILVFVYLAVILSPKLEKKRQRELNPWWLAIPALTVAGLSIFFLIPYFHADKAVSLADQGEWQGAALEMETAAKADSGMAIYWLQAGYAYGRAAESDHELMQNAIMSYEKGISIEPIYSLNHANLAPLLWSSGNKEQALQQLRIATNIAPQSTLLLLNRGTYEESLGLDEDASSSYSLAIKFQPNLIDSQFWSFSALRVEATQAAIEVGTTDDPRKNADAVIDTAMGKISNSEFPAALSLLQQAHDLDDQNVSLYVTLGQLAFDQDDFDTAEKYVQMALWIQATNNQDKVEAILLGAEISLAKGDDTEALRRFEIAYQAILADTSYGWGSRGWSPYAWFVFQRESFAEDLLPQLERVDIPTSVAQRLLPLADLYEAVGDLEKANEVRLALQPYLP